MFDTPPLKQTNSLQSYFSTFFNSNINKLYRTRSTSTFNSDDPSGFLRKEESATDASSEKNLKQIAPWDTSSLLPPTNSLKKESGVTDMQRKDNKRKVILSSLGAILIILALISITIAILVRKNSLNSPSDSSITTLNPPHASTTDNNNENGAKTSSNDSQGVSGIGDGSSSRNLNGVRDTSPLDVKKPGIDTSPTISSSPTPTNPTNVNQPVVPITLAENPSKDATSVIDKGKKEPKEARKPKKPVVEVGLSATILKREM